eukprot:m.169911 g.169911  ORF g.169911 m.169911 type:complete len:765 (-) comp18250_c1_seq31:353-2647(-)
MDLRASLPPPGSSSWRSDRAAPGEDENLLVRIRHVVIRESSIQQLPKPHVVYHIDVITQNDRWSVSRRYSDFLSLQLQMLRIDPSSKDLIPGKRVFGNLSPALIESRRQGLERYLQRLVISDKAVFSDALMNFLDANEHNAVWVTQRLAKHLSIYGERILSEGIGFHLTGVQCQCIGHRLKMPIDLRVDDWRKDGNGGESDDPNGIMDAKIEHLYDFVVQLTNLHVHPTREQFVRPESAPVESVAVNISVWRALQSLSVDHYIIRHFTGFQLIQENLTKLKVTYCQVQSMREMLMDAVVHKKPAPQARQGVEDWRQHALKTFAAESRLYYVPWVSLVDLDLGHNSIAEFDVACLEYLPALERLSLRANQIPNLDAWFRKGPIMPRLKVINLSRNRLVSLEMPSADSADRNSTGRASRTSSVSSVSSYTLTTKVAPHPHWKVPLEKSQPRLVANGTMDRQSAAGVVGGKTANGDVTVQPRTPLPFGHVVKPTPENTPPPSYHSHHLISTNNPAAPLDELQRLRTERMNTEDETCSHASVGSGGTTACSPAGTETPALALNTSNDTANGSTSNGDEVGSPDVDRRASLPIDTEAVSKIEEAANSAAIGGEIDQRKRATELALVSSAEPHASPVQPLPQATVGIRPLHRLAPGLTRLRLSHNCLRSLKGLEYLHALAMLDVSHNLIKSVADVSALINMTKLSVLLLQGNPMTSARGYRTEIITKFFGEGCKVAIDAPPKQVATITQLAEQQRIQRTTKANPTPDQIP